MGSVTLQLTGCKSARVRCEVPASSALSLKSFVYAACLASLSPARLARAAIHWHALG